MAIVNTHIPLTSQSCEDMIQAIVAAYPFCRTEVITETAFGRPLRTLVIGNGPRKVIYSAAHHANEWITSLLLLKFAEDFAQAIDWHASHLHEFIKGKRNLNEELAIKLESQLGIPFKTWMSMHNGYIYDCIAIEERQTEEQVARDFECACDSIFNIQTLYKRLGLSLQACNERVKKIKELFPFDLLSSNELKMQVAGMYKHSEKVQIDEKNMLTWLILNYLEISKIQPLDNYENGNALQAAKEIATITFSGRFL